MKLSRRKENYYDIRILIYNDNLHKVCKAKLLLVYSDHLFQNTVSVFICSCIGIYIYFIRY